MEKTPASCHETTTHTRMGLNHLSPAQIEQLHQAALDILERTGVIVAHPGALELLRAAGASVE